MAGFRYVVCDVFTDVPLAGNQLAVFTDAREIPEEMLQRLAREMNYSETTFVYPPEGEGHVKMRIFTPNRGDAVRGASDARDGVRARRAAPARGAADRDRARRRARSGSSETGRGSSSGGCSSPCRRSSRSHAPTSCMAALGVESRLPVELYDNGIRHVYVAAPSEAAVAALEPDLQRIATFGQDWRQLLRRARARAGRRACSRRAPASSRTRRPAPRPVRSRCIWRGTA